MLTDPNRISFMKLSTALTTLVCSTALAVAEPAKESDYYRITTFPIPAEAAIEVGSMELLPDGKVALGTRRGDIFLASDVTSEASAVRYKLFATGQRELLGLGYKDGALYATDRAEVVRVQDKSRDGLADTYEAVSDAWGVTGDGHEYAFGSRFDKNGDLWVALCLTGSFTSEAPFRGWALRIKPDGSMVPTCSGIRSPGGIGFDAEGEAYYTDNEGPWHGSSTLQHLVPGSFQGHPAGNLWYPQAPNMGPRPVEPNDDSRMVTERARIKELLPPAVYMVHGKIGNSSSFIATDLSGGKFGPFAKQIFVGDQSHSNISRVFLETVNGIRQGVVIPFLKGFKSGLIAGRMSDKGQLFVGGADRGWGARGGEPMCFERVDWTGKVPFEIHEMRARPDGFELTFTHPVDAKTASDPASYKMREFTYIYRSKYGSPEVDEVIPKITSAVPSADGRSVRLVISPLTKGHIHELHVDGLRSVDAQPLLHPMAYYTLNEIPNR
jgi:glucose/arabinose dehydrogenase